MSPAQPAETARERGPDIVRCPHCRNTARADKANPWRPFCSQRCKLIDLGKWINEENRIPEDDSAPES